MRHIKIKRFLDSEQIQISDKIFRPDRLEDDLTHSYLYTDVNKRKMSYKENPFTSEYEYMMPYRKVDEIESIRVSRSRTITKLYDIARSNMWEWFFTLTFNPEKVDSFDYSLISKKLSLWLNNMRKKCPDMVYIVVPEQHKSGRWHFHGLFSNVSDLVFVDSGKRTEKGQIIYNVGNYNIGWSTAIQCDASPKVVSYLCKYITKELCQATKGKKRYWASRNVNLPGVVEYDVNMEYEEILKCCDLENSHYKNVEGYVNVTYVDAPIYSTNTSRFVESETSENNIAFDSGID